MTHFDQLREDELQDARMAITMMRNATTPDQFKQFERSWKDYVGCMERVWYKLNKLAYSKPAWKAWMAQYKTLRKTDDLLAYLHQARCSREHSLEPLTERTLGLPKDLTKGGKPVVTFIARLDADGSVNLRPGGIRHIHEPELQVQLIPITHEGVTYRVPDNHLGKRVHSWDPVQIAEVGFQFYSGLVDKAEMAFID